MKYLVLLAVVACVLWWVRSGRTQDGAKTTQRGRAKPVVLPTMAHCPVCGVHFPSADGTQGKLALYCSEKHRLSAES
jgi:hypothetical protein